MSSYGVSYPVTRPVTYGVAPALLGGVQLPPLPPGYVFYVDLNGAFLVDINGNFFIGPA